MFHLKLAEINKFLLFFNGFILVLVLVSYNNPIITLVRTEPALNDHPVNLILKQTSVNWEWILVSCLHLNTLFFW